MTISFDEELALLKGVQMEKFSMVNINRNKAMLLGNMEDQKNAQALAEKVSQRIRGDL